MTDKFLEELYGLMNEKDFDATLKPKGGGKVVHFTNKDNYEKALKSGDYEEPDGDDVEDDSDDETQSQKVTDFSRDADDAAIKQPGSYDDMEEPDRDEPEDNKDIKKLDNALDSPSSFQSWLDDNEYITSAFMDDDKEELQDFVKGWEMNLQDLKVAKEMGDEDEVEYLSSQAEDFKDDIKNLVSNYLKTDEKPSQSDFPIKDYEKSLDTPDDYEDWLDANEKDLNLDDAEKEELEDLLTNWKYTQDDIQVAMGRGDDDEEDELRGQFDDIRDDIKDLTSLAVKKVSQDKPKDAPKGPKYEPAGAADAWQVRTNVMNSIGRDKFRRLSYGDLEAEYAAEFKKLGFEKIDGKWQKKVSENHELKDQYIRFFER